MRYQKVGDGKKKNKKQGAQADLRPSSLLPRQFPESRRWPAGKQSPTAATDVVFFKKRVSPRRQPAQSRFSAADATRSGQGGRERERARSRRSRGQNTPVPLAALPATTVAAGGETRERERRYNRRRLLLTKQRWVRASWRW